MPTASAITPSRRQRWMIALCAFAISSLLGLGIGELMVRIFSPRPVRTPIFDRVNGLGSVAPNIHGRVFVPREFDTTVTTGPQRFRGRKSYSIEPPAGTIRIATIGDSFTFGEGANDDESYPFLLEQILRSRKWPVEVMNAGVGGTGTGEEALYFDEYVRTFHPRIVILGVVANDPDDDARRGLFRRNGDELVPLPASQRSNGRWWRVSRAIHYWPPVAWLFGHSQLLSLVQYQFGRIREGATKQSDDAPMASHYGDSNFKLTHDEIGWLAQRVAASGAQFVVAYLPAFPSTYEVTGQPYELWRREEAELCDATAKASLDTRAAFLDLRPYMRQVYAAGHPKLYHQGIDEHPTAAGYAAFAHGIADFLERSRTLADAAK